MRSRIPASGAGIQIQMNVLCVAGNIKIGNPISPDGLLFYHLERMNGSVTIGHDHSSADWHVIQSAEDGWLEVVIRQMAIHDRFPSIPRDRPRPVPSHARWRARGLHQPFGIKAP